MQIKTRLHDIIEGKDQGRWPLSAALLQGFSTVYGSVVKMRADLYEKGTFASYRLNCKVISVGNLTTGGTGKTPMVRYLAGLLQSHGKQVAVISRGYKGKHEKQGGLVSDKQQILMHPSDAGDEPYMLAQSMPGIPVLVGQDRLKSGYFALEHFKPDVVILDDGFQHLRIRRDLNLLLLDAGQPYGNGYLLPRGKLREPVSAFNRADAVILTRSGTELPHYYHELLERAKPRPVLRAFHTPVIRGKVPGTSVFENNTRPAFERMQPGDLQNKKVLAFSGLANNDSFGESVGFFNTDLQKIFGFDDHHHYTTEEMNRIGDATLSLNCEYIVTSEKDFMRIPAGMQLPVDLIVIGVDISLEGDDKRLRHIVLDTLFGTAGTTKESSH